MVEKSAPPLLISGYFKLPSKRPHAHYIPYLNNFFKTVQCQCVFFTSEEVHAEIKDIVPSNVRIHIFNVNDMTALTQYGREFWDHHAKLDFVKGCGHTPELGMIWYEKKEFVLRAMKMYPDYPSYIWCDAGSIRDDLSVQKATLFGFRDPQWLLDDRLHVQGVSWTPGNPAPIPMFQTCGSRYIGCSILAGTKTAWLNYKVLYDQVIAEYSKRGIYCIDDQYVTVGCLYLYPTHFVQHNEPSQVDEWFKFLEIL